MASPFLSFAGGFAQGVGQGAQVGMDMAQRSQYMKIQKQQADLQTIGAMGQAMKITDPALRTLAVKKIMPSFGMNPEDQGGKDFLTMVNKSATETLNWMSDALNKAGLSMPPSAIGQAWQNDPTGFMNMLFTQQRMGMAADIATGDGSDGGTQQPVAGAASEVSQNGTTTGGSGFQPMPVGADGVARPYAQPNTTQPAATAQPDQTTPQPVPGGDASHPVMKAAGMPVATTGGTPPTGGQNLVDHPELMWDSTKDPYVIKMQHRIMQERRLGEAGAGFAESMQKNLDTFIANKNQMISNAIRGRELDISGGQLAVSRGQLGLAADRLRFDMSKPLSPIGQLYWDAEHGHFVAGGTPGTTPASGTAAGTGTANGGTNTPTVDSLVASGAVSVADVAPAGSIPVTDTAILKQLGVTNDEKVVLDRDTGKPIIIRPTNTSLNTDSQHGDAQMSYDNLQIGRNIVSLLQGEITKNPGSFGSAGAIANTVQNVLGNVKDFATLVPQVKKVLGPVVMKYLPPDYFDPQLPANIQLEHVLASMLAREMQPPNTMGGFDHTLKKAEDMTDITKLGQSNDEAKAKLATIDFLFSQYAEKYKGQLGQGAASNIPDKTGGETKPTNQQPEYTEGAIKYSTTNPNQRAIVQGGKWVIQNNVGGKWQAQ